MKGIYNSLIQKKIAIVFEKLVVSLDMILHNTYNI